MSIRITVAFVLLVATQPCLSAEIYKWVDKDGKVHYSDSPPPEARAKIVTIEDATVKAPDEGELRRRKLLQQADENAVRLIEEQHISRDARRAHAKVTDLEERACVDARIQLEILKEQAPVYRDDRGHWRAKWKYDTYKGPRSYLDDGDRPAAVWRAQRNVEAHCVDPDNTKAQALARNRWIFTERCAAAEAELKLLEHPDARNPKSVIEGQRRIVQLYCDR